MRRRDDVERRAEKLPLDLFPVPEPVDDCAKPHQRLQVALSSEIRLVQTRELQIARRVNLEAGSSPERLCRATLNP
jgi:hypothetical protein